MTTNYAVAGLGFGDEGKGMTVARLCADLQPAVVVKSSGGPQCAHNVTLDDHRHHTHAQLGSGTLLGVRTHIGRDFLFDPLCLLEEDRGIQKHIGSVLGQITVDPEAVVVTPWHREEQRAEASRAGTKMTTGMGIEPTRRLALHGICVRARDLRSADLEERLEWVRSHLVPPREGWQNDLKLVARAMAHVGRSVGVGPLGDYVGPDDRVIYEGGQGVLLDQWVGFNPYTTWADTTFASAEAEHWNRRGGGLEPLVKIGVTRTFHTRHGEGPFPSAREGRTILSDRHNLETRWTGPLRQGWLDMTLLEYAVECAKPDALSITHLDVRPVPYCRTVRDALGTPITLTPTPGDLHASEVQARLLTGAQTETFSTEDVARTIHDCTDLPIAVRGSGSRLDHYMAVTPELELT